MNGLWKAVSDYPFNQKGFGPMVMISFVRDGGRTTRMAYATRNAQGLVAWHCTAPLPVPCIPDIWLDGTPWSSAAGPDYASAIVRKVEELTGTWPSREPKRDLPAPRVLAAE